VPVELRKKCYQITWMFCFSFAYMYAWYLRRPEEGIRFLGMGVIDDCMLPCGCWELNLGLLEVQETF
ncbi:hypothetical protein ACQP3L_30360, partial [Escherichia coli]